MLAMRVDVQGQRALLQNAGPYNENTLVGVPDEVNTGEQFGSGEKVNVCKFPLGSVNAWNVSLPACSPRSQKRCTPPACMPVHLAQLCGQPISLHWKVAVGIAVAASGPGEMQTISLGGGRMHEGSGSRDLRAEEVVVGPCAASRCLPGGPEHGGGCIRAVEALHPVPTRDRAAHPGDLRPWLLHCTRRRLLALRP